MMDNKKICVITGASSGIGYAIADSLQKDSDKQLVITARRQDRLAQLKSENIDVVTGDMLDTGFMQHLENFIYDKYGRCDYLFNCAGIIHVGTIEEIDVEKMSAMLRLNIESTFRLIYQFLKRFRVRGSGHVVNISSVLGTKVRPTAGAYAATKFALEALSESLRMELTGTNIQISCVEPGLVMTELHDDWQVHPREGMGIHEPLTVDDVVRTVRFIIDQPEHVRIPRLMILPKDHHI